MLSPAFAVDEGKRTATSREFKGDADRWNERKDMAEFLPTRWLITDENGKESFDRRAAPLQTFGAGIRGCYGKIQLAADPALLAGTFLLTMRQ